MNKREMARDMVRWGEVCSRENRAIDALLLKEGAAALEREAEREEKPSGGCSVSIAGGLVHGEFEQVKAVQALILENEKLRREASEREDRERPKVTLKEQVEACIWASGNHPPMGVNLAAAAATLRKLDEEGGEFLQEIVLIERLHKFLRSLGVEKKP